MLVYYFVVFAFSLHIGFSTSVYYYLHSSNCKKLTSVNITGCGLITDSAIYQLVRKCTAIQTLHLNSCQLLTDASIAAIVEANMHPGLAVLSLRDCPLITEVILQWLVQCMPTSINVSLVV